MKKFAKIMSVLFASILAVSVFAFAEETEAEKTYIVYPKETVSLFSAEGASPRYMVIGEEELNLLLEEAPEMIDWYEENVKFHFSEIDYNWTNTSSLVRIKASKKHNLKYQGEDITVGIIDSGVFPHNEYKDRLLPGHNYVDKEKPDDTTDTLGHGTTVAGVLASANDDVGIDSVAPRVKIVPLKVDNSDGEPDLDAVASAIWGAVDTYECDVINLSLGTTDNPRTLKEAIDHAVSEGVTVVAAVGNYAEDGNGYVENDTIEYPAAYDNVIGVGSIDWLDYSRSPFSKKNNSVFITAPGDYIVTTYIDNTYVNNSYGTSLSAPLVTGAVALLKQANPDLTPAEIMDILAESARDDSKGDGYDTAYGHGVLNVAAAIELAEGNEMLAPDTVTYTVSAENSELNGAVSVEDYVIGNIGSHPLGASFTAKAEPTYKLEDGTEYKFAYWENGNGAHVSGEATYTFNATSNFTLCAVYDEVVADESATTEKKVEFWNGNGILLDTAEVDTTTGKASIPEKAQNPTMTGYAFDGWLDEDEKEFTADSILEKNLTRVVAQFTDATTQYSITFDDNTDEDITRTGNYGDPVEYTANDVEKFDYWKLGDEIISYDSKINIALWGAKKELTAVYNEENVTPKPTVVLDEGADGADFLIYSVPDDYTIIDAGIVFGTEGSTPRVASFHSKASVKKLPENAFGQFTSLPGDESHEVARGYLIYKDTNKVTRVIYSD